MSTTRSSPAAVAPARCGRSSTTASSRTSSSRGKTLGGGLPLASVTGRADVMDAVHPGGLGGTFGGNPVACAAAIAVLDELSAPGFARARRPDRGSCCARASTRSRRAVRSSARCAGSARCSRSSSRSATATRRRPSRRTAREHGLILLSCGLVRKRHPASAAALGDGRGAGTRARHPRGGTWRRRLRLGPRRDAGATAPAVRLTGIRRTYGDVVAIADLDLDIAEGEFFTMLGPSGSGKTTTLRVIAGFERPDAGKRRARGRRTSPAPRRRSATSTPSSRTTRSSRT